MFGRGFLFVAILAAAVVVPYLLANEGWTGSEGWWSSLWNDGNQDQAGTAGLDTVALPGSAGSSALLQGSSPNANFHAGLGTSIPTPHVTGPPVYSFGDVIRFDATPAWVMDNWSRVTTSVGTGELTGLRVPLMTGTESHDLAGSLTYFFDRNQQVKRIHFHGHTGDARQLVAVLTQTYALRPEPELGAGTYAARWNRKMTSVLRVTNAPIVRSDASQARLHVLFELNRPDMHVGLSQEMQDKFSGPQR